jgi:hypothetical protein
MDQTCAPKFLICGYACLHLENRMSTPAACFALRNSCHGQHPSAHPVSRSAAKLFTLPAHPCTHAIPLSVSRVAPRMEERITIFSNSIRLVATSERSQKLSFDQTVPGDRGFSPREPVLPADTRVERPSGCGFAKVPRCSHRRRPQASMTRVRRLERTRCRRRAADGRLRSEYMSSIPP